VTDSELAILSLVVEGPRHGYEIEATIVERHMRNWADIGFSSIYYHLDRLERAGLVSSRRQPPPHGGPARRVYTATAEGVAALHRHARQALSTPTGPQSGLQIGLSVLPRLDPVEAADALIERQRGLEAQLDTLRRHRPDDPPSHVAAMFDLAATRIEAELGWLGRFLADLRRPSERSTP
jgi:DNA-binding PadR family transcriptional regulator